MQLISAKSLASSKAFFYVLATTHRSQIASMVLKADQTSGEYGNEHARSDQILYVVSGKGTARIEGEDYPIQEGDTVVIEAGEQHQIRSDPGGELRTINIYSPPAY